MTIEGSNLGFGLDSLSCLRMGMKQAKQASATAQAIGIKAITFLAGNEDDLLRFVGQSGLDPADLRARAGEPDVLAAVLEYLLSGDALLVAFCDAEGLKPADVHRAHHQLCGA